MAGGKASISDMQFPPRTYVLCVDTVLKSQAPWSAGPGNRLPLDSLHPLSTPSCHVTALIDGGLGSWTQSNAQRS